MRLRGSSLELALELRLLASEGLVAPEVRLPEESRGRLTEGAELWRSPRSARFVGGGLESTASDRDFFDLESMLKDRLGYTCTMMSRETVLPSADCHKLTKERSTSRNSSLACLPFFRDDQVNGSQRWQVGAIMALVSE